MPRAKTPPATIDGPDLVKQSPPEMLQAHGELLAQNQRAQEIAIQHQFNSFDEQEIQACFHAGLGMAAKGGLMMGRSLSALMEIHDASIDTILLRFEFPISRATAYNAVRVYRGLRERPKLQEFAAYASQAKVLELLTLPEEELQKFESGQSSLTVDELDQMTRDELKQKVRELKASKQDTERLLSDKEKTINDLDRRIGTWRSTTARDKAAKLLAEVAAIAATCRKEIKRLNAAARAVGAAFDDGDVNEEIIEQLDEYISSVKNADFLIVK